MPSLIRPVYPAPFADPFVWRAEGAWFAIGTGSGAPTAEGTDARVFPLLGSDDMWTWHDAGHALVRPEAALGDTFWAPEVAHAEGQFWLYYSVGHGEQLHHIRVASSPEPLGPYVDRGALTDPREVPFAIDPHPFRDHDGRWYLFYARDFLDSDPDAPGSLRAGTALVVRALADMTRLEGDEHVVLRARCDWQRYQRDRAIYGRVLDWHTLEGPCVLENDGAYFCLYSGGCWQNDTYGVDFCVSTSPMGPFHADEGIAAPRVLHTIPEALIGPGHCSVTRSASGAPVVAYHAWDRAMTARRMFLAPLAFGADGPRAVLAEGL